MEFVWSNIQLNPPPTPNFKNLSDTDITQITHFGPKTLKSDMSASLPSGECTFSGEQKTPCRNKTQPACNKILHAFPPQNAQSLNVCTTYKIFFASACHKMHFVHIQWM